MARWRPAPNQSDEGRGDDSSQFIGILQDIQAEHNYLPLPRSMQAVGNAEGPLQPPIQHRHFLQGVQPGAEREAYHHGLHGHRLPRRKAPRIVDEISRCLGVKAGETTQDRLFTLETVNCLGTCALGPVVVVDGKYYGNMTVKKVGELLKKYAKEKE